MEYTFRISADSPEVMMVLTENEIQLKTEGAVYRHPYSSVQKVWLNNPGGFCSPGEFSCTLNIVDKKPIYIASKNYDKQGHLINQANHYNTFVRVLHMHVKSNAKAKFRFGATPVKYAMRIATIISILATCLASSLLIDANPLIFIMPSAAAIFVTVCGLRFCITRFPKGYNPDDIPLNLLPG